MQQRAAVRQRRRGGRKKIILITIAAFLALCIGASAIYLNIHYSAGEAAMQAMQGGVAISLKLQVLPDTVIPELSAQLQQSMIGGVMRAPALYSAYSHVAYIPRGYKIRFAHA